MSMTTNDLRYHPPARAVQLFWVLAIVGVVALAAGLFLEPQRTWGQVLLISNYLVGLGLGGLLLVALHYVTGARWSIPIRRVPEALSSLLPLAAVGLLAVLVFRPSLYSWTLADVPGEPQSPLHRLWLNRPFFLVRALVYLALWMAFAAALVRNSRRQDRDPNPAPTRQNTGLSAAFLVVFGITCWLASSDWIMSLEPSWASTIFGVYYFAGLFLSCLAAVIVLLVWLGHSSPLQKYVNASRLHDLGTLLFAFSSFWMYIWFCQYLLIWYVNNPEETAYLRLRWQGPWPALMLLNLILNWASPFVVLLFRGAKRNPLILGTVALVVLVGRWIDLLLMILPSQGEAVMTPGVIEAGLVVGSIGTVFLTVFYGLSKAPLVPVHEPGKSGE
jgi:hypothetical protein